MKKILSNCLAATFVLFAAVSCDRKSDELAPGFGLDNVSSSEDFLHFLTESDYDSALVNPKLSLKAPAGFVSLSSALTQAPNARTDADEKKVPEELTRLLNKDGVMQVGNWVVKLNFEDKLVRVIGNDQKKKLYAKLLKEQKDDNIYVFSFEDEVFALLDEGITESPTLVKAPNGRVKAGILCGGGISSNDMYSDYVSACTFPAVYPDPNTAEYRIGTSYVKFGVYFRLRSIIRARTEDLFINGVLMNSPCLIQGTFNANIYWRSNCRNYNEGTWNPSGETYNLLFLFLPGQTIYEQFWTLYSSGRGLRCIRVFDFRLINQNTTWSFMQTCNI